MPWITCATDVDGNGGGNAPMLRRFLDGTDVVLTASASANGLRFQGWKINGLFVWTQQTIHFPLSFDKTSAALAPVAVFAATAPTRSIVSGLVEGPSTVAEGASAQFKLRVTYSDGLSEVIPATWALTSSAATVNPASGLLDAGSVSSDQQVDLRASFTLGNSVATSLPFHVTIANTNATATYTLSVNSTAGGSVVVTPDGRSFNSGTLVHVYAQPESGYKFSYWSGDAITTGNDDDANVLMTSNRSVAAHFVIDDAIGAITVNLSPPLAVAEGAQWKYRNFTNWRDSGNTQSNIPAGNGYVYFKDIPGWHTPEQLKVPIVAGQPTPVNAVYREILGAVQVTITPAAAATAGARWRLDGGAWTESGVTLADASTGAHTVEFLSIPGWTTPPSQSIAVSRGISTTSTGDYGPPAGVPIITSVSPRTGPIDGGTTVTIDGVNFLSGAAVSFGGVAATSVTVVNSTRITAVTPARASYGSVALALTSGGQTVTQASGFSYLNALGSNMELVGQIGGNVEAVAVVGNIVYYNEGTGFVVSDFTNSAAPVERGRITLPDFIKDIVVVNNVAFVATDAAGLYAVDVSTPVAPSIIGFFDTDIPAKGVAVSGEIAYVTCGFPARLEILNVSNPAAIVPLGQLQLIATANADRISVGTIGSKKYAFVAEDHGSGEGPNPALRVIDVTTPSAPVEVSNIPAQSFVGITDAKIVGTNLYVSDWQSGIKIFNVSNPATPVQTGLFYPGAGVGFIDIVGNNLYTCNSSLVVGNLAGTPNPTQTGVFGLGPSCLRLVVAANLAFAAAGSSGLKAVAVSNPASMSLRSESQAISSINAVRVSAGTAFVGTDSGLLTVDVSIPTRPVRLATLPATSVTNFVMSNGIATLLQAGSQTVRTANVANPSSLSFLGTYTGVQAWDVALMGSTPILAAATKDASPLPKVDVLNISTPSNPQSAGSLLLDTVLGVTERIAVSGNWAFIGRSNHDLDVVSLGNPALPNKVGTISIPTENFLGGIAASEDGNYVYVSSTLGIQVVDVTVKTAPVLREAIDPSQTIGANVTGLRVAGNRLFAAESGFIFVFDIFNAASPQIVAYYDVPGIAYGNGALGDVLSVVSDLIYVVSSGSQISILRLLDVSKPAVTITSPTANTNYPTAAGTLSLGGAASDDKGVVRVSWQNDRGGGGIAQGTSAWTIPAIQLAAGSNVVTVTAEDAQGNLARDTITVTATLPDANGPSIVVTGPNPSSAFTFAADTLPLTGTAADASGVQAVSWANDRGGSGTATGTSAWTASIPLIDGPNRITVTARDTVGNESHSEVLVTYAPLDTTAPTVSVTFPTDQQEAATSEPMVNVSGEAEDNRAVTRVAWSNNRGGAGVAAGTGRWTANGIALLPGLNILTVTATDSSGNVGSDALAVTYTPHFSALSLTTAGTGTPTLTGKPDLAAMEVGKLYTAEAKPAKGWIFAGWEGSVVSNSKRVSFVMEEGATLHAVFVENPYDEIAAVYRGLLRADPLTHSTSGDVALTLTTSGAFTAQFTIGGDKLRLKGAFDGTGTFLGRLRASPTLDVLLALDTATPDSPVTGLLSDGTTTMALNAWPTVKFSRTTPAVHAGEYTLAIESGTAPAPVGSGFGMARVSTGGGVKLKGRLANGAKFSAGTAITSGNRVPLYMSLDKGSSSFGAPLAFADKPDSDLDGIAFWSSAREASAKYPFAPFTLEPRFFAQRYTPPARGGRALSSLNATNGAATLTLGTHTQTLTLGTDNRLAFGNPLLGGFSMKLKAKTGEFSGSLLLDGERVKFGGVLMQKSGDGVGALPDAAVTLEP